MWFCEILPSSENYMKENKLRFLLRSKKSFYLLLGSLKVFFVLTYRNYTYFFRDYIFAVVESMFMSLLCCCVATVAADNWHQYDVIHVITRNALLDKHCEINNVAQWKQKHLITKQLNTPTTCPHPFKYLWIYAF